MKKWSVTFVGCDAGRLEGVAETARAILREREVASRVVHREHCDAIADLGNAAADASTAEALLFLSDEFEPWDKGWLRHLVGYLTLAGIGAVGPRFVGRNGRVVHAGLLQSKAALCPPSAGCPSMRLARFISHARRMNALHCQRMGLLVRHDAFLEAGGFEPGLEDTVAIGLRFAASLRARGWRELVCADVDAVACLPAPHWSPIQDAYYNPNLALERPIFEPRPWCPPLRQTDPVRVLFVSHNLELEGAPLVLFDLVAGLVDSKSVEARILSPRDGPLAARYRERGIAVELFDMPGLRRDGAQLPLCVDRIAAAIECHRSGAGLRQYAGDGFFGQRCRSNVGRCDPLAP